MLGAARKRWNRQASSGAVSSDRDDAAHEGRKAGHAPSQYKDKSPRTPPQAPDVAQQEAEKRKRERRVARAKYLPPVVPKHVTHCYDRGARDWWIYTWKVGNPNAKTRIPYRCNSWRCEHCAEHEAAVLFARIKEACAPLDETGFCFFVLTLDRDGKFSGKPWETAEQAFRELGSMTSKFLKRLRRFAAKQGWTPIRSQWVATVEAHKSGWPHVNLLIYSPELADWLKNEKNDRVSLGFGKRESILLGIESTPGRFHGGPIFTAAVESGWGVQSTAEGGLRGGKDAIAGYMAKVAGSADRVAGEIAKVTQRPLAAPERFRRLRSGVGFLPPRMATPEGVTGTLVRRTSYRGTVQVLPLHNVKPASQVHVSTACYQEEAIAIDEQSVARWNRQVRQCGVPEAQIITPPVSVWGSGRAVRGP